MPGRRAHSARSWLGVNAIHGAADILATLAAYEAREVEIDGCTYREGLNAVGIQGGNAGNVIPDECRIEVNFRYAPDRDEDAAEAHVREVFADVLPDGATLTVVDNAGVPCPVSPSRPPRRSSRPLAPRASEASVDVARFAAFGIPGSTTDPGTRLAHTREEHVLVDRLQPAEDALITYLSGSTA